MCVDPVAAPQIPLGKEELSAVGQVFKSNWLGYGRNGNKQDEFVKYFSKKLVVKKINKINFEYADPEEMTTISCCSEALFQAIKVYVKEGDEVIMPTISFVAAANAVISANATPIFCV